MTDQKGNTSVLDEAKGLLVQGKKYMALEDYQQATDHLEQSCQLFDAYYGVAKRECADAYLEYGLALVALANLEAGNGTERILKKAGVAGDDEDDEEEEGEDGDEEEEEEGDEDEVDDDEAGADAGEDKKTAVNGTKQADNAPQSNQVDQEDVVMPDVKTKDTTESQAEPSSSTVESDKPTGAPQPDQDVVMGEEQPTSSVEAKTNGQNGVSSSDALPSSTSSAVGTAAQSEPVAGTSNGNAADAGDDSLENEEASTIEIAWEVLCLAKRLYMTDESLEGRMKLAETLQKIGEISIEWENNDNAVSILEECLKIRQAILRPDDRLIALTYYHLGLAYSFKSDTVNANEHFQKAISVIEQRIETLTSDLDKAKSNQETVAVSALEKEINELKELLPDMTMRLDDSKEDGTKSTEALKRTREELQQEDEEVKKVCLDKSKPVDNINHLVKRKAD